MDDKMLVSWSKLVGYAMKNLSSSNPLPNSSIVVLINDELNALYKKVAYLTDGLYALRASMMTQDQQDAFVKEQVSKEKLQ